MKVMVTGAAGYIGSMLASALLQRGHRVVGIDSLLHGGDSLIGLASHPDFHFVRGDIRDRAVIQRVVQGSDAVVHLAAIVGEPACNRDPVHTRAVNLDASLQLLEVARRSGVGRFVFASTCSNYGKMSNSDGWVDEASPLQPLSVYAETKVAVERALLDQPSVDPCAATVLRFSTIFGLSFRPRFDLTVNEFAAEAWASHKLVVYGEQFWRPYVHVRDAARAAAEVLESPADDVRGRVFNVGGTDQNYTKKMLVDLLLERLPATEVEYVRRDQDPRDYRVRFGRIEAALGFRPSITVAQGIAEVHAALEHGLIADFRRPAYRN